MQQNYLYYWTKKHQKNIAKVGKPLRDVYRGSFPRKIARGDRIYCLARQVDGSYVVAGRVTVNRVSVGDPDSTISNAEPKPTLTMLKGSRKIPAKFWTTYVSYQRNMKACKIFKLDATGHPKPEGLQAIRQIDDGAARALDNIIAAAR